LRGAVIFGPGMGGHANAYCRICQPIEMIELTRLWLADDLPANSESRVIGVVLRALRKGRGRFRAVLSYADEHAGHIGTIYQATNFRYMGISSPANGMMRIGNRIVNQRSLTKRYGTHSIDRLQHILGRNDIAYVARDTRKHAYVFPLTDEVAMWLDAHKLPYPKRS